MLDINTVPQNLREYPCGPALRMYFDWPEIEPSNRNYSEKESKAFAELTHAYILSTPVANSDELATLIDELYKMGFSEQALLLHNENPKIDISQHFHGLLALGAAALIENDLKLAEGASVAAQALAPKETAPYFNTAMSLERQQNPVEALKWCLAGLELEPNHEPLWQLAISINITSNTLDFKDMWQRAVDLSSWVGIAMLHDSTATFSSAETIKYLSKIYSEGNRTDAFLVDYTARLGQESQFDEILRIIWDFESPVKNWMLVLHGYQASLALDHSERAQEMAELLASNPEVPAEIKGLIAKDMMDNGEKQIPAH